MTALNKIQQRINVIVCFEYIKNAIIIRYSCEGFLWFVWDIENTLYEIAAQRFTVKDC